MDAPPAPVKKDANGDVIAPSHGHRVNIVGYDDARGEWIVNDSNKEEELTRYPYEAFELGNRWSTVLEKK
ncbi:hypothetical protein [Leptospira sp.]|uniref:hypothetical protein n=1 Tax=Leptospira sp. TaxID=178 RepID=UPI0025C30002|nr:hypothetical protein [Leptospira sp.]